MIDASPGTDRRTPRRATITEDDEFDFTNRWCWALALAVRARIGGRLVAISDDVGWLHVGVEIESNDGPIVIDVLGARPTNDWVADVDQQTLMLHDLDDEDISVGPVPPDEIATMPTDSGSDIARAMAAAEAIADAAIALVITVREITVRSPMPCSRRPGWQTRSSTPTSMTPSSGTGSSPMKSAPSVRTCRTGSCGASAETSAGGRASATQGPQGLQARHPSP